VSISNLENSDDPIHQEMIRALTRISGSYPFYSDVIMTLDMIEATGCKWCRTMATDGRHLYWSREFVKKLTRRQLVYVLIHEVGHCIHWHMSKRGGRDPGYWNMACDFIINYDIENDAQSKDADRPAGALISEEFPSTMSAWEVYEILVKRKVKVQNPLDTHLEDENDDGDWTNETGEDDEEKSGDPSDDGDEDADGEDDGDGEGDGDGDSGEGESGEGEGEGEGDGEGEGEGEGEGNGEGDKPGKGGKGKGSGKGQGDGDEDGDADGPSKSQKPGKGKGKVKRTGVTSNLSIDAVGDLQLDPNAPPKLSAQQRARAKRRIRDAVMNSVSRLGAGNVPLGVRRLIKEMTEPTIDWRDLLQVTVDSAFMDNYSFIRPHRYAHSFDMILPGEDPGKEIEIGIAMDASGSIGDEQLKDFLGETYGIFEQHAHFTAHVFSFDTVVNEDTYLKITPENLEDFLSFEIHGGGGTLFEAVFEFIRRRNLKMDRLVFFTDMYPNASWGDPTVIEDVLWIAHNGMENQIIPPFGIVCPYTPKKRRIRRISAG